MSTQHATPDHRQRYEGDDSVRSSTQLADSGSDSYNDSALDLEGQRSRDEESRDRSAAEYYVPTGTKYVYLGLYFALNLALTMYNKVVLGKFAFPWLLTTIHTGIASIGCYILLLKGQFSLTRLTRQENLLLFAFSMLYTVNIAISNVSLWVAHNEEPHKCGELTVNVHRAMVSLPFHQTLRSTCPMVAVLIYRVHYRRRYATATYLSLIPLVLGVSLATYGDYYFTPGGFFLSLLGVILASLKTVASNRLMTGNLALPALELLLRMSPLASLQSLVYSMSTGEARKFVAFVGVGDLTTGHCLALTGNGILAFLLSVASLYTNKLAGALTMTVCANLKQCLTVLLGILIFNVRVGVLNGYGMLITLVGAAVYSKVELDSKGKIMAAAPNIPDTLKGQGPGTREK
ncbi:MAG: hypothetical protein Q9191_000086 [Dirinaria sp. TL-2023a]